ncbi:MAG: PhzF family phenazine biosynthesis protein [Peptococcaceae bacterium]
MKIYQVDSFTAQAFAGNPAAVCILAEARNDEWLQNVAREMNLSETAFLLEGEKGYFLRWFTPAAEVDLCGHATLAAAHILWEKGYLAQEKRGEFYTRSGLLTAELAGDWIKLDFPSAPPEPVSAREIVAAMGREPLYLGKNRMDYLLEYPDEEIIRNLKPDLALLARNTVRGVIVTSKSANPEFDFISRFFAPGVGIDEDPVTGSAHCCLGPYWQSKTGRAAFTAFQASQRGGILKVEVLGERTVLCGQAVTVMAGELFY